MNRTDLLGPGPSVASSAGASRLPWVDRLKAIALLWVALNHVAERMFGYPYAGNPSAGWPPLADRVAQLAPAGGHGLWDVPLNALRYVGWAGDQGVQLFLILSGFALTRSLGATPSAGSLDVPTFYRRRARRIYPLWWGAHAALIVVGLLFGTGIGLVNPRTWLSLLGIRATADMLYYGVPAWWYVGLQLQLYLVYPLLLPLLRRIGPGRFLAVTCGAAFAIRGFGLFAFDAYLDAWSRGAVFITRLPEFAFGMALAGWMERSGPPAATTTWISAGRLPLAILAYLAGTAASLSLPGMIVAPFLLGCSAFVMLRLFDRVTSGSSRSLDRALRWVGAHAYSLYLVHHAVILALVPAGARPLRGTIGAGAAAAVTVGLAVTLERVVAAVRGRRGPDTSARGFARTGVRVAAVLGLLAAGILGGELLVRRFDPQEILGWGERPSLQPDARFDWTLIPSRTTRLRWDSYDYVVKSNSLGFPGPEYPVGNAHAAFRVLTVGDAFTSAEGVDTDQAWPRVLEIDLNRDGACRRTEVLNFAVTGYGPEQYTAVVEAFVPRYEPDLVLVEFFVNELDDVLASREAFHEDIGFGRPDPDGLYARLRPLHLRRWLEVRLLDPVREVLTGRPSPYGYFLGAFAPLERDRKALYVGAGTRVAECFGRIRAVCAAAGAPVWIVMAPAPVQVCEARDLACYPRGVDLSGDRYDLEQPQRLIRDPAAAAGFDFVDLRPPLQSMPECPYHRRNLHWTVEGHRAVASFLAERIGAIFDIGKTAAETVDQP